MRRSICDILLIVLLVSFPVVSNASDQTTHGLHHVAFWGGGGYSGLVNGYENNTFVGGGGGLLGMGYEYRYGHLIIDAGAEFRVFSSLDKISFPSAESVPLDVDGNNMTKHFLFDGSLRENHVAGQVMIPLMIGGRWDMWYFLVGAKAGYSVFDHYTQRGSYSTTVTDADAYDPYWADMPAHGALSDVPYKKGGAIGYGLEVTASAEVGMSLNGVLKRGWNAGMARRFFIRFS